MPKLIRLYIQQCAIGFAIAAVFVAMLLSLNVGNLWHLVSNDPAGVLAVFMLWVSNGVVFAGVQFGITVMRMGSETDDRGPRGGLRQHVPIPVRSNVPQVDRRRR